MVNGDVNHDRITRFLPVQDYSSRSGRTVRGINLLNVLYYCNETFILVAFELVKKPIHYNDLAIRKLQRKSEKTKNELVREMIETCIQNALKFRVILMDSWFSSEAKFEFITEKGWHFMAALEDNSLIALSEDDRKRKRFVCSNEPDFPKQTCVRDWLKGYAKEVLEVQCQLGQVPYTNATHPKQPRLHGHLRHLQARMIGHRKQAQSFRAVSQATHQRIAHRLCPASGVPGGCITSVTVIEIYGFTNFGKYHHAMAWTRSQVLPPTSSRLRMGRTTRRLEYSEYDCASRASREAFGLCGGQKRPSLSAR